MFAPLLEDELHLISDSHNLDSRKPNLGPGTEAAERVFGRELIERSVRRGDALLLEMCPGSKEQSAQL